jgi:copper(I)-binding protein
MMSRIGRACAAVACVALVLVGCASQRVSKTGVVTVNEAWAVDGVNSPTGAKRAYVYFVASSTVDDEIVGAAVPGTLAARALVEGVAVGSDGHLGHLDEPGAPPHTHAPITRIALPKGVAVRLQPGGHRIVLDGLASPLRVGDQFAVDVIFAKGSTVTVSVVARQGAAVGK